MYILGVDQGSTKTMAIIADDTGRIRGKGLGAGACHFFDGMDQAMCAVEEAARQALSCAEITSDEISFISAGMAGANWPAEITLLKNGFRDRFRIDGVKVYNDCLIAMRGGTQHVPCGVICAGTGLNAALCPQPGTIKVYNNYIEDWDQGAGGLGQRTLRAIFLSAIGVLPATRLTEKALEHFALDAVDDLLLAYQHRQLTQPIQELCPLLFQTALQADVVALNILAEFGVSVSRYLVAGIKRYGLEAAKIDVVLSGGVFKAGSTVLFETIAAEIHRTAPHASVINARYEPVVGAMLWALDEKFHGDLPDRVLANCQTSAEEFDLIRVTASG